MSFEYKAGIPSPDGTTETVVLTFNDIALLPIGILLDNRGNPIGEMWDSLLWGVGDDQLELLKRIPQNLLKPMLDEWRESEGVGVGGIRRLVGIIDRHGDALEADLIRDGLRLRHCPTPEFNWRDLHVYVKHMGAESHLFRAMFPDNAGWNTTTMLLADIADTLHWLQWAKTKDGQRNRGMPKRIPRPGVTVKARPGLKPKAAPLSVVKERLSHDDDASGRAMKLKTLFDGR